MQCPASYPDLQAVVAVRAAVAIIVKVIAPVTERRLLARMEVACLAVIASSGEEAVSVVLGHILAVNSVCFG
jgi:hypothetical protein